VEFVIDFQTDGGKYHLFLTV